jgi:hypothetical protein
MPVESVEGEGLEADVHKQLSSFAGVKVKIGGHVPEIWAHAGASGGEFANPKVVHVPSVHRTTEVAGG